MARWGAGRELIHDVFARASTIRFLMQWAIRRFCELPLGEWLSPRTRTLFSPLLSGRRYRRACRYGTVNDQGEQRPALRLCSGSILEEVFRRHSSASSPVADTARSAGVLIVTGDTKVVDRGAADGIFINTAGVASSAGIDLGPHRVAAWRCDSGQWDCWRSRVGGDDAAGGACLWVDPRGDTAPNGLIEALRSSA